MYILKTAFTLLKLIDKYILTFFGGEKVENKKNRAVNYVEILRDKDGIRFVDLLIY